MKRNLIACIAFVVAIAGVGATWYGATRPDWAGTPLGPSVANNKGRLIGPVVLMNGTVYSLRERKDRSGPLLLARAKTSDSQYQAMSMEAFCGPVLDLRSVEKAGSVRMLQDCSDASDAYELVEMDLGSGHVSVIARLGSAHDGDVWQTAGEREVIGTFPDRQCDAMMTMDSGGHWSSLGRVLGRGPMSWPVDEYIGSSSAGECGSPGEAWYPTFIGKQSVAFVESKGGTRQWRIAILRLDERTVSELPVLLREPSGLTVGENGCILVTEGGKTPGIAAIDPVSGDRRAFVEGDFRSATYDHSSHRVLTIQTVDETSRVVAIDVGCSVS